MAGNSRFKCMRCNRPPQWEIKWAEGRARAWFCDRHMKQWEREDGDVLRKRQVDGVVGAKWSDPVQKPPLKGFVKEAYDERKHKRAPKGSSTGGQFTKGGGVGIAATPLTKGKSIESEAKALLSRRGVKKLATEPTETHPFTVGYYINPPSAEAALQHFKDSDNNSGGMSLSYPLEVKGGRTRRNLKGTPVSYRSCFYSPDLRSFIFTGRTTDNHMGVLGSIVGGPKSEYGGFDTDLGEACVELMERSVRFHILLGEDYKPVRLQFNTNYAGSYQGKDMEKWSLKAIYRAMDRLVEMGLDPKTPVHIFSPVIRDTQMIKTKLGESWAGFSKKWRVFAEDAAFEQEHPRGKGGRFSKKRQEWSGVSKEKWTGQERSELVSNLRSGAVVSQEVIDRYPDVKSALGETAEKAADRLGFVVEDTNLANDEFDRAIFGEVPDVLELNELGVIGGSDSHPVYGGVHVGDVEYWAERLSHDYGYAIEDAKALVIYGDEGDVLTDDPQYAIPDESGIKAESGILVTARKELKRGVDFDVRPLDTSELNPERFSTIGAGEEPMWEEFVKEAYDESKHKRVSKGKPGGGQFTRKGRELGGAEPSKIREDVLSQFARNHSHDTIERAIVVGDDGNVLVKKSSGAADYVEFTKDEMKAMAGATLTHNHPHGHSFSFSDIAIALREGLHEVQAVSHNPMSQITYLFSMKTEGWRTLTKNDLVYIHTKAYNVISPQLWDDINSGAKTAEEAEYAHHHLVWSLASEFAKEQYGVDLGYSRREIPRLVEAYDEGKHKRVPKGKPGGGQFTKKGRELGGAQPTSEAKAKDAVLRQFIQDHAHDTIEHGIVVDDDGNVLVRASGDENYLRFTDAERKKMRGATMTHNHPGGQSFSNADIDHAYKDGLKEIQAIGFNPESQATYLYSMKMEKWKGLTADDIDLLVEDSMNMSMSAQWDKILWDEMTPEEADVIAYSLLWEYVEEFAKERHGVDIGYSRTEIK